MPHTFHTGVTRVKSRRARVDTSWVDRPATRSRFSWICRDQAERERFLDLHARLVPANVRVLVLLVVAVVIVAGVTRPTGTNYIAVLPAVLGVVLFGGVQRRATAFARPELWVLGALLGSQAAIVVALSVTGMADSPAIALLAWPAAGLAGRFKGRPLLLGAVYTVALAAVAMAGQSAQRSGDPIAWTVAAVGLLAVCSTAAVLRDSDLAHRSAAVLDGLTGMLNRAALSTRAAEIELQSRITRDPVGLIVVDIDHFKAVNDTHGHVVGDAVLQGVAYVLRRELRSYELAYRLGGEEFAVLLLGADHDTTAAMAERLRVAVAATPIEGIAVTISVGATATAPDASFEWATAFREADALLYQAKENGRDQVVSGAARPLTPHT